MSDIKHCINLSLGDWSHDGHCKTSVFTIQSSLGYKELEGAYKKGVEIVGLDIREEIAFEYEDNKISQEDLNKLRVQGYDVKLDEVYNDKTSYYLDENTFVDMFLWVVKKGNPKFKYEFVNATLAIGGYGLFLD